ncbi:hypothetical protein WJX77_008165 [Trebouxia sp. C0004]
MDQQLSFAHSRWLVIQRLPLDKYAYICHEPAIFPSKWGGAVPACEFGKPLTVPGTSAIRQRRQHWCARLNKWRLQTT